MKILFPILTVLTTILLAFALYEALVVAPTEQTMGDVQRIFYYHVPSAWTAFILFFVNFGASIVYLMTRKTKADIVALVSAEVGVVFLHGLPHHRSDLGATGLGHLVDMGYAPDFDLGSLVDLRQLSFLAEVLVWRPDACSRGCACRSRGALRALRLLFHLVFPHAASATGDGRRRID